MRLMVTRQNADAGRQPGQRGFSMVELLVAVLVLSIGLLGMAALMATSLRNNQSANFRSQAINLAYDYVDMVRANVPAAGSYVRDAYGDGSACAGAGNPFDFSACTNQAQCDRQLWDRKLCATLPNGRGRATIVPRATGGSEVVVDVCWADDRSLDLTAACPTLAAGASGQCAGGVCVLRLTSGI